MFQKYLWFQEPVSDEPDLSHRESAARFDTVDAAIKDLLRHLYNPRGNCIIRAGIQQPATPDDIGGIPKTLMAYLGNALALRHFYRRLLRQHAAVGQPMPGASGYRSRLTPVRARAADRV